MKKVNIDQETCIGCRVCESTCPEVFVLSAQGKSTVVEDHRKEAENEGEVPEEVGCVKEAEDNCPVDAISVS